MDATTVAEAPNGGTPTVLEVADLVVELVRSFGRAKARLMSAASDHDVEWSAQVVLRHLAQVGPMRSGAVADSLQSDPSTVSRQVAALVKDGLLERRADPEDGRACILVLTPRADDVLAAHEDLRRRHFATVMDGWSEDEMAGFAVQLRRFTEAFDTSSTTAISERQAVGRQPSGEGKH